MISSPSIRRLRREALSEFIEKMGASRDPVLWQELVQEELKEVEEALAHLLKEFTDLSYVLTGLKMVAPGSNPSKITKNRLFRVIEMVEPAFLELLHESFPRVHASNMSKLGDDGKPVRREDGKILKGPNYKPPYLLDIITGKSE